MKQMNLGWSPSKLDGTEYKFQEIKNLKLPSQYSFINHLPPVLDQGETNMCVTYSLAVHIDWNANMDFGTDRKDNKVNKNQIYEIRTTPGDNGMTFKEALSFLKKKGVQTKVGVRTIQHYALVGSEIQLKQAIITNGPCVGGLMVYNFTPEFWRKRGGDQILGGHAIAIVGWNEKGFIIRNSWGTSWGQKGYSILPYDEYNKLMLECWTIID